MRSRSEFVALVEKMRATQKRWFKYRKGEDLTESRRLEREVDRAIQEEREPRAELTLFDTKG